MKAEHHLSKRRKIIIILINILVIIGIGGGIYFYTQNNKKTQGTKFIEDALAENGRLKDGVNNKKLLEELQKETDKNKFGYGMNSKIEFQDGKSPGAMCIENPSANSFNMQVQIKRNDTQEIIYTTAEIAPGYGVESAKLHTQLKKGQYACTAVIAAIKDNEKVGEVQMPLLILVNQ